MRPSKMQPLATTQLMMTWLSMCPADEPTTRRQKIDHIAYTLTIFVLNVIFFAASLAYCLKFFSIDFEGATFAFMCAVGEFGAIYFMFAAIRMRQQIYDMFANLSTIYKNNENEVAFHYLARVNNTSEWMWTIYSKYVAVSLGGMAGISFLSVLHCYWTQENLNVEHFHRPAKLILPWNQDTYIGYLAEIIISNLSAYGFFILNGTSLLLFVSLCIHHRAFSKMFKHKINNSEKCDAKLLSDLIRFHISAKDLFVDSANVYSSFVLVQLICSTAVMTVSTFYLDLQWQQFDFTMVSILVTTSVALSTLLLYCYFGKLATESYEMMSDCVYKMEWYEQPNELQKHFILMIQNMQKPVYYHGFYVANLDLRTFIKLCNSVFSYYMVIKTLAAK